MWESFVGVGGLQNKFTNNIDGVFWNTLLPMVLVNISQNSKNITIESTYDDNKVNTNNYYTNIPGYVNAAYS